MGLKGERGGAGPPGQWGAPGPKGDMGEIGLPGPEVTVLTYYTRVSLWSPYGIGQTIYIFMLFMVALCNRADHYIFAL